ncbi:MAG: hypothetical protein IJ062_13400 [Firmicutes bacterium]|nr:hypothetical protein [Bacillota bacterium]
MRKSLLKTIVATAVVGATMLIGNIATWAATTSEVYYAYDKDVPKDSSNSTAFTGVTTSGSSASGTATMGVGEYTYTKRTSAVDNISISFSVPSGKNGNFYILCSSNGTSARTLTLKYTTTYSQTATTNTNSSLGVCSFTNLNSGTYTLTASGKIYYAVLALDLTDTEITDHEYVWQLDTTGLDSDIASNLKLGATTPASNTARKITYSGSKFNTTQNFPETVTVDVNTPTNNPSYINVESASISNQYNKYTITVTPPAVDNENSWFEAKPSYAVSGNVYDSTTGNAISNLSVSATNGTGAVTTGTGFNVTDIIGSTTVTFSATGYYSKTVTYTAATTTATVDLVPTTAISDNTTVLTTNKIYTRAGFEPEAYDNFNSLSTAINVNNFSISGSNAKLQFVDSKGNSTAVEPYNGRINLNTSKASITYQAPSNGRITIYGKTGSNGQNDRSVVCKAGSTQINKLTFSTDNLMSSTFGVTKDTTYTFTAETGQINVYAIVFEPLTGIAATATNYGSSDLYALGDNCTYIIHKVSSAEAASSKLTETTTGMSTTKAYKKVKFSDDTYLEVSDFTDAVALYAFKATNRAAVPTATLTWTTE